MALNACFHIPSSNSVLGSVNTVDGNLRYTEHPAYGQCMPGNFFSFLRRGGECGEQGTLDFRQECGLMRE